MEDFTAIVEVKFGILNLCDLRGHLCRSTQYWLRRSTLHSITYLLVYVYTRVLVNMYEYLEVKPYKNQEFPSCRILSCKKTPQ